MNSPGRGNHAAPTPHCELNNLRRNPALPRPLGPPVKSKWLVGGFHQARHDCRGHQTQRAYSELVALVLWRKEVDDDETRDSKPVSTDARKGSITKKKPGDNAYPNPCAPQALQALSHAVSATCDAILQVETIKELHVTLSNQRVFVVADPRSVQLVCENKAWHEPNTMFGDMNIPCGAVVKRCWRIGASAPWGFMFALRMLRRDPKHAYENINNA